MKLSDLETVRTLRDRLSLNSVNVMFVDSNNFWVNLGGKQIDFNTAVTLKGVIKQELLTYFNVERDALIEELNKLGVEVPNETR